MNEPNKRPHLKAGAKVCLFGAIAVFGQMAQGGEAPPAYVLTAITDQARGLQVLDGAYDEVIEHLAAAEKKNRFAENNNLCVAYTKTNNLAEAEKACTAALKSSTLLSRPYDSPRKIGHAVALSNRGVIRAVSGDIELARRDFQEARKADRYLSTAAENLAILEERSRETVSALQ